jgi:hypothetical protein
MLHTIKQQELTQYILQDWAIIRSIYILELRLYLLYFLYLFSIKPNQVFPVKVLKQLTDSLYIC